MSTFGKIDGPIIGAPSLSTAKLGHVLILISCGPVLTASAACVPKVKRATSTVHVKIYSMIIKIKRQN